MLEAKVALNRLTAYLNQPEITASSLSNISPQIIFDNATISWPAAESHSSDESSITPFVLKDVNLVLPEGKFTLIVGPLGSGKTLFVRL